MRLPSVTVSALAARLVTVLLLIGVAQTACVYRMPIQQGNFLEPRLVDRLEVGMTRAQVRYLLGTPMVPDTFDTDRWDYLYYLKKGRIHAPVQTRLTVYFAGDKVARFEKAGTQAAPRTDSEQPVQPEQPAAKPSQNSGA
jgi:outer membrane protein assembly factor BamE